MLSLRWLCEAGQVKCWGMSFQAEGRACANHKSTWEQGRTSSNSEMERRVLKGLGRGVTYKKMELEEKQLSYHKRLWYIIFFSVGDGNPEKPYSTNKIKQQSWLQSCQID